MTTTTDIGTDVSPEELAALESLLSQSQIALEDLNAYFGEVDECLLTEEEEAAQAEAEALQVSLSSSLEQLSSFYRELKQGGHVGRSDAAMLKGVSISTESMQSFFNRYPLNSFTETPSKVNYQATCEGLGSAVIDTVIRLIKQAWELVKKVAGALWAMISRRKMQDTKADMLDKEFIKKGAAVKEVDTRSERLAAEWDKFYDMNIGLWTALPDCMVYDPARLALTQFDQLWADIEQETEEALAAIDPGGAKVVVNKVRAPLNTGISTIDQASRNQSRTFYIDVAEVYMRHYHTLEKDRSVSLQDRELQGIRTYVKDHPHARSNALLYRATDLANRVKKGLETAKKSNFKIHDPQEAERLSAVMSVLIDMNYSISSWVRARTVLTRARDTVSKVHASLIQTLDSVEFVQ